MGAPGLKMTSEELAHVYAKLGQDCPIITVEQPFNVRGMYILSQLSPLSENRAFPVRGC